MLPTMRMFDLCWHFRLDTADVLTKVSVYPSCLILQYDNISKIIYTMHKVFQTQVNCKYLIFASNPFGFWYFGFNTYIQQPFSVSLFKFHFLSCQWHKVNVSPSLVFHIDTVKSQRIFINEFPSWLVEDYSVVFIHVFYFFRRLCCLVFFDKGKERTVWWIDFLCNALTCLWVECLEVWKPLFQFWQSIVKVELGDERMIVERTLLDVNKFIPQHVSD